MWRMWRRFLLKENYELELKQEKSEMTLEKYSVIFVDFLKKNRL